MPVRRTLDSRTNSRESPDALLSSTFLGLKLLGFESQTTDDHPIRARTVAVWAEDGAANVGSDHSADLSWRKYWRLPVN